MTTRIPIDPAIIQRLKRAFGSALAERMGYGAAAAEALGALLTVEADNGGVAVEFTWPERPDGVQESPVDPMNEAELTGIVVYFAESVEGNLKEERGLSGKPLPWD